MPDCGSKNSLMLTRMPDGGYVVSDGTLLHPEYARAHYFAATSIDEALAYMKSQICVIDGVKSNG